jgi:hypothetical protein
LRVTDELALRILEMRIMRRLYGRIFAKGNWQIRTNSEINELIGHDNIIGGKPRPNLDCNACDDDHDDDEFIVRFNNNYQVS